MYCDLVFRDSLWEVIPQFKILNIILTHKILYYQMWNNWIYRDQSLWTTFVTKLIYLDWWSFIESFWDIDFYPAFPFGTNYKIAIHIWNWNVDVKRITFNFTSKKHHEILCTQISLQTFHFIPQNSLEKESHQFHFESIKKVIKWKHAIENWQVNLLFHYRFYNRMPYRIFQPKKCAHIYY